MEILISEGQIARRIQELAAEITDYYRGKPLTVIILMNGGLIFGADLVRAVRLPLLWDAFSVSSYDNDRSSGRLRIRSRLKNPVEGRHLLVADVISDSGLTLKKVIEYLDRPGVLSIRSCVLLDKCLPGKYDLRPDWVGFEIPDRYVVGYGMDSCEDYRNLPYIAVPDTR